jgi:putative endonuclease
VATLRQRRGSAAESTAARYVRSLGWQIVDRNVRVERDEIDILALDPGPPAELVCVEVRSATSAAFGAPEERVDHLKVAHLYRAMRRLPGPVARGLQRRVDLVVVEERAARRTIRHLRRLAPP